MTVSLRPVEDADIDVFYEHQADPAASEMAAFPSRDLDTHRAHWERTLARDDVFNRTVIVDGAVAGNVVSWRDEDRRLVGYWIGRQFWGRGVASEALRLFVEELGERPLHAYVAVTNVASARVLEKAGFVGEAKTHAEPDGIEERLYVLA